MTPELRKDLLDVKGLIEKQIRDDVQSGRTPKDTIKTLFEKLDPETVKWFFAETVKAAEWDGRFYRRTKEWAFEFFHPLLSEEDGSRYGQISDSIVHRAHVNQLVEVIIDQEGMGTNPFRRS